MAIIILISWCVKHNEKNKVQNKISVHVTQKKVLFPCGLWLLLGPYPPAVENTKGENEPCSTSHIGIGLSKWVEYSDVRVSS